MSAAVIRGDGRITEWRDNLTLTTTSIESLSDRAGDIGRRAIGLRCGGPLSRD
ncbi:MAG TPA: hypothetical protein VIM06_00865 [Rhodanobacter sp.]